MNQTTRRILLTIIIIFSAVARFHHLAARSLSADELMSVQNSTGRPQSFLPAETDGIVAGDFSSMQNARPWQEIWSSFATDTHPPLYTFVFRAWRNIFGDGDFAARSLSVAFSLLIVLLIFDASQLLHGSAAAFWIAAITAFATPQIVFAQETRSYAMVAAMMLLACDALIRMQIFGNNRRRLLALGITIFAAMFTHYVALPMSIALAIYAAWEMRGPSRRGAIFVIAIAAVTFVIIWGSHAWAQRPNFTHNLQWLDDNKAGFYLRWINRLATLPLRMFITPMPHDESRARLGSILYLLPLLAITHRKLRLWALLIAAVVVPVAIADLTQHRMGLSLPRYLFPAAAPTAALVVAAAGLLRPRYQHAICAILVICCVFSLPQVYDDWRPPYLQFATEFDRSAGADDLLIVPHRSHYQQSILLTALSHYSRYHNRTCIAIEDCASELTTHSIENARNRIWILSGNPADDPAALVPGATRGITVAWPYVGAAIEIKLAGITSQPSASPATTLSPVQ